MRQSLGRFVQTLLERRFGGKFAQLPVKAGSQRMQLPRSEEQETQTALAIIGIQLPKRDMFGEAIFASGKGDERPGFNRQSTLVVELA